MPASPRAKAIALQSLYQSVHQLMLGYAPPFMTRSGMIRGKPDFHLLTPKPVVIPGSYGGKPTNPALASVILQKGYVGFYFMPVYVDPALKTKLSPALVKLLKGKSCFYLKRAEESLLKDIDAALKLGVECFKKRGWL